MKKFVFIVCFVGWTGICLAQEPVVEQTIEDLLESTGESMSDDTDFQEILDDLEGFRQSPLNINEATADQFSRLHLLSEAQISNIIQFREKTGTIFSLYELASVDGFTQDVLEKIQPFVSFEVQEKQQPKKRAANDIFIKSTRIFSASTRAEQSKYEGSAERVYFRFKHSSGKLNYGLVSEKDPGEAFLSQSEKQGFDYASAYANFGVGQADNRIFAGDFHVRFGQGLLVSQGFSIGKSAETTQVFRSGEGIRSYSSTDENLFFRGLAGQFQIRHFTLYPFLSNHKLDAHTDTLDGIPSFGAFQTSGYHRTESEIAGKNSVDQFTGGAHVTYAYERWTFGITGIYNHFNVRLQRDDEPYNQFLPEGKRNLAGGFNWRGTIRNVFVFGEMGFSEDSGKAILTGVVLNPASTVEFSVVYRNINKTYFSYFSNSFAESSRINDEQGIYVGLKILPAPHWVIRGYADFFRFKWIKYTTAAPTAGTEIFAQVTYNPTPRTSFYFRLFQEDKGQRWIDETLKYNTQQLIRRIRLNFTFELNEKFSLKSRFEKSMYSKEGSEAGFLILQDLIYKPAGKLFAMNGRIVYFNTDSYNSRLYAYESDLLYSFSVPALYGKGFRAYLNLEYRLKQRLTIWLKLASTLSPFSSEHSDDINPESKAEAKIQVRYQF